MNFISLKELCDLVEISLSRSSYEYKLYSGLRHGKFRNDQEAQRQLYGNQKHGANYYSQIKTKLKTRLINSFYSSDITIHNKAQEQYHQAHKLFCIAEELIGRRKANAGVSLMKESLKLSKSLGLTSIATLSAQRLAFYYGTLGDEPKAFLKYKKIFSDLSEKANIENELRLAYVEVSSFFNNRWGGGEEIHEIASRHLERLSHPLVFKDVKLCQIYYNIKVIGLQAKSEWKQVVDSCGEAINAIMKANPKAPFQILATFKIMAASSYIQLQRYSDADETIVNTLAQDVNAINRQVLNFFFFISKLNQFDLVAARNIYDEAQDAIQSMPEKIFENWRIAWAYYAFIANEPVRVGKLMNEVPIYSKDKEGSNFAILIVQLLNYLKEGKIGFVIDRMDSLSRYKRRYLKKDPRAAAFVALLSCLSKGNFSREKVETLSASHLEKLQAEFSISDIELVRYELLWGKVLELLD